MDGIGVGLPQLLKKWRNVGCLWRRDSSFFSSRTFDALSAVFLGARMVFYEIIDVLLSTVMITA